MIVAYRVIELGKRVLVCPECMKNSELFEALGEPIEQEDLESTFDGIIPNCYSCCEEIK